MMSRKPPRPWTDSERKDRGARVRAALHKLSQRLTPSKVHFSIDEIDAAGLFKPGAAERFKANNESFGREFLDNVRKERAEAAEKAGEHPAFVAAIRASGVRLPDLQYIRRDVVNGEVCYYFLGEEALAWQAAILGYLADHPEARAEVVRRHEDLVFHAIEADTNARGFDFPEDNCGKGEHRRGTVDGCVMCHMARCAERMGRSFSTEIQQLLREGT